MADSRIIGVLDALQSQCQRATYGAVGEFLGIPGMSVSAHLGDRSKRASFVVAANGQPTGYKKSELHPDLFKNEKVIRTGQDLTTFLRAAKERKMNDRLFNLAIQTTLLDDDDGEILGDLDKLDREYIEPEDEAKSSATTIEPEREPTK